MIRLRYQKAFFQFRINLLETDLFFHFTKHFIGCQRFENEADFQIQSTLEPSAFFRGFPKFESFTRFGLSRALFLNQFMLHQFVVHVLFQHLFFP